MQRRTFFERVLSTVALAPLSWLAARVLLPSTFEHSAHRPQKISLGRIDQIFSSKNYVQCTVGDTPAIVIKNGDELRAYSLVCTHAHCTLQYADESKRFLCPCHGGEFDEQGKVVKAPPQEPMHRLFTSVHDGEVFVSEREISS